VTIYLTEEKSKTVVAVDVNVAAERIPVVRAGLLEIHRHIQRLLLLLPLSLPLPFLLLLLMDLNISHCRRCSNSSNIDIIIITTTPSERKNLLLYFSSVE
jgi:hypothetical protein